MGELLTRKKTLRSEYTPNYFRICLAGDYDMNVYEYDPIDVKFITTKNPEDLALQYKINNGEWIDCNYYSNGSGYTIYATFHPFSSNKEVIWFRRNPLAGVSLGLSDSVNLTYISASNYMPYRYNNNQLKAEGNIMSLLDATMQSKEVGDYGFQHLFMNSNLLISDKLLLPATTLGEYCYYGMFSNVLQNIASVPTTIPKLPAKNLSKGCYQEMFSNCYLGGLSEMKAENLAEDCCKYMYFNSRIGNFSVETYNGYYTTYQPSGCDSININLPAMNLAKGCYEGMFAFVSGVISSITLPAEILTEGCYRYMFYYSYSAIPLITWGTTKLAKECCMSMFDSVSASVRYSLPNVNDLEENCYYHMYNNISYIYFSNNKLSFDNNLAPGCFYGMFSGSLGLSTLTQGLEITSSEMKEYCCKYMFANSDFKLDKITLSSMILAKGCYEGMFINLTRSYNSTIINLPAETLTEECYKEMFEDANPPDVKMYANVFAKDSCSYMYYNAGKKIGYTIGRLHFEGNNITLAEGCFRGMFAGSADTAYGLGNLLPNVYGNNLAKECFMYMFYDISKSANSPYPRATLPFISVLERFTNLEEGCYYGMYAKSKGALYDGQQPHALPATTLAENCYYAMFKESEITDVPEIYATTLADGCCYEMFAGTNITNSPVLLAETLASYCYKYMFKNCANLEEITAYFKDLNDTNDTLDWVDGVAAQGVFNKKSDATWTEVGSNGVPSGWTINLV